MFYVRTQPRCSSGLGFDLFNQGRVTASQPAECPAPFNLARSVVGSCATERLIASSDGVCAYCCPAPYKAACSSPSETVIKQTVEGCKQCCEQNPAAVQCADVQAIGKDANGCYSCKCVLGDASITCGPGEHLSIIGGRSKCCIPDVYVPPPPYRPAGTPVSPSGVYPIGGGLAPGFGPTNSNIVNTPAPPARPTSPTGLVAMGRPDLVATLPTTPAGTTPAGTTPAGTTPTGTAPTEAGVVSTTGAGAVGLAVALGIAYFLFR